MRTTLLFILFVLIFGTLKSQNNISFGINTSFSYNKIIGGIELTKWKNLKQKKYTPIITCKFNYGLIGYKTYHQKQENITMSENSISISNSEELPSGLSLPKNINDNYKGFYYNSFEKIQLTGYDFSLIKEFKLNDNFFFGTGVGWNYAKNSGYIIWYNPIINDKIREIASWSFHTVSALSNFGYTKSISNHFIFKTILNFRFFVPIKNGKQTFIFPSSMSNVGVEGDLSISLNYLF